MPKGRFKPVAKVETVSALPSGRTPRSTKILSPCESERKMSPLGAVRSSRGSRNVDGAAGTGGAWVLIDEGAAGGLKSRQAYSVTLKPGGATGQALSGRATRCGPLLTASSGLGSGRSARVILWR